MIVKQLSEPANFFCSNGRFRCNPLLKIQNRSADLRVIGENSHHLGVLIEPLMPRIRRQQHFLFLAKMHVPRLVPEAHELCRLPRNRRRTLFRRSIGGTPHFQRLNQGEVVVLAKGMQTWMAFHGVDPQPVVCRDYSSEGQPIGNCRTAAGEGGR